MPTPSVPTTTPPQRVPYGPPARFLTHPNAWWHALGHDAAHVARAVLPVAAPIVGVLVALVVLAALVRLLARLRAPVGGHLVEVAMPPTVEAKAALGFWRNLHSVLCGAGRLVGPPGQVAFEIESSAHGVSLRFWVSSHVSAHAVARAVSSSWPGAQCQVRDSADVPRRPGGVVRGAAPRRTSVAPPRHRSSGRSAPHRARGASHVGRD